MNPLDFWLYVWTFWLPRAPSIVTDPAVIQVDFKARRRA
jgi:hypothetical protein